MNEHELGRLCLLLQVSVQEENRPDYYYICTILVVRGGITFWNVDDQHSYFSKSIQKIDT
jgi:hypothetical protein